MRELVLFFGWNSSRVTISLHWSFCIWESAVILNLATFFNLKLRVGLLDRIKYVVGRVVPEGKELSNDSTCML